MSEMRRHIYSPLLLTLGLLFCVMIIPAFTGQAHAAADVDFKANYNHDFSVTQSNHTWITNAPTEKEIKIDYDTGEVDEEGNPIIETKTYKGRRLSTVLKNAKLTDNKSVRVNGKKIENPTAAWLVEIDGVWVLYYQKQLSEYAIYTIEVDRGRDALKLTEAKADKENPLKGDKVTISYSIDVDDFYKNSDEFKDNQEQILGLEWTSSSNRISPRKTETNDREGSFEVTVEKAGDISIFVKSTYDYGDFSYLGEGTEVSFRVKKPTMKIWPASVKLKVGQYSNTLKARDGSGDKIPLSELVWTSSNEKVAVVNNGKVQGIGKGNATITITSNAESSRGATARISVTVVGGHYHSDGRVTKLYVFIGTRGKSLYTAKIISERKRSVAIVKGGQIKKVTIPATVTIDGKRYKVTQIKGNAFAGTKATTVTIGANVSKIKKNAFRGSKVKTVILKTKKLKKSGVKGCLRKSNVRTVKVKLGKKKDNRKYIRIYKKVFVKKVVGRKVSVK